MRVTVSGNGVLSGSVPKAREPVKVSPDPVPARLTVFGLRANIALEDMVNVPVVFPAEEG